MEMICLTQGKEEIESKELQDFIESTLASIDRALKNTGYRLTGPVKFQIAVVSAKRAEGGLKLLVVDASGKYDKESTSRIEFEVFKMTPD